jgi:lysine 6-dehydrogenase
MPWKYAGQVKTMEYKTLRYPGHAHIMQAIRGLGLLDGQPVTVKGQSVVPRDVFIATAGPRLKADDPADVIALQVVAQGRKSGGAKRVQFRVLDQYDTTRGISAMMRTTGYSLSITGQLQVAGEVGAPGVRTSYEAVPFAPYVAALQRRGIEVLEG